jgi:hypothetical protein
MAATKYSDSLRDYGYATLKRDGFTCRYRGLDGTLWPNWLYLSWDHLLPKGHPQRDDPAFIVAPCRFCNEASNRTRWETEGKTPEELVEQKKPIVLAVRATYREYSIGSAKSSPMPIHVRRVSKDAKSEFDGSMGALTTGTGSVAASDLA